MVDEKGSNKSFENMSDHVTSDAMDQPTFAIKTNVDPKDSFEDNPYFDKNKSYSKEELEKFKRFFEG